MCNFDLSSVTENINEILPLIVTDIQLNPRIRIKYYFDDYSNNSKISSS